MKGRKRRSVLQSARADGDEVRRPPGHLITKAGSGAHHMPVSRHVVWESNPKLQGGCGKPNHQPSGDLEPTQGGAVCAAPCLGCQFSQARLLFASFHGLGGFPTSKHHSVSAHSSAFLLCPPSSPKGKKYGSAISYLTHFTFTSCGSNC